TAVVGGGDSGMQKALTPDPHDLRGVLYARERLLHAPVPPAAAGRRAVAQERRVAARALAHAFADEPLLARHAELRERRAGRDHDRARRELTLRARHAPTLAVGRERVRGRVDELDAGGGRLLLRHRAEVVARHAVRKARHALDLVDAHELATDEPAR